jgi:hypothetical protein
MALPLMQIKIALLSPAMQRPPLARLLHEGFEEQGEAG